MYVCIHKYTIRALIYIYTYMYMPLFTHIPIFMYRCMHMCRTDSLTGVHDYYLYPYLYGYLVIRIYVCTTVIYMYMYIYKCIYVCIYVYMYYIYTCGYRYTSISPYLCGV